MSGDDDGGFCILMVKIEAMTLTVLCNVLIKFSYMIL